MMRNVTLDYVELDSLDFFNKKYTSQYSLVCRWYTDTNAWTDTVKSPVLFMDAGAFPLMRCLL